MSIAQDIYTKVKSMPIEKAQTVLEFVNFLQFQSPQIDNRKINNDIAKYAGMVDLPQTGKARNLDDFNPADIFTSTGNLDESY